MRPTPAFTAIFRGRRSLIAFFRPLWYTIPYMTNQHRGDRFMSSHNHKRSSFSGKLGFVLSAAGASVGLGNIWRFPYLAAKYGGGIFLLVYIVLALTFGYTMIVAETALGRMTKKSPVGATIPLESLNGCPSAAGSTRLFRY